MNTELKEQIKDFEIDEQLRFLSDKFSKRIAFSTSFGLEDQVISDIIFKNNLNIEVFTLDTGRLFEETYKVWSKTIKKYNKKIKVYYPENKQLENLILNKGPFSFYETVENRRECCDIRKVKQLSKALKEIDLWITGLRSEQSEFRSDMDLLEKDESLNVIKFNPLKNWSQKKINRYIKNNSIPYNELYDKSFISIGCSPCTRAVKEGENIRAGRWWWEDKTKKECGLHITKTETSKLNFSVLNNK